MVAELFTVDLKAVGRASRLHTAAQRLHAFACFFPGAPGFTGEGCKRCDGGGVQRGAVHREMRTVAGAIPAAFQRIPVHVTAHVRAGRRAAVEPALLVTVGRDFGETLADDRAMSRLELIHGFELARRNIFGEILHRGHVLRDEVLDGGRGLARGVVKLFPGAAAVHDKRGDEEAGHHAVGHALTGIAGRHVHILAAGVAPDKTGVVDRVQDLARPAMGFAADGRHKSTYPGFQTFEPRPGVIDLAGLMVGAAYDQVVGRAGARLEADVMINVERIPIETIEHFAARDGEGPSRRYGRAPAWCGWRHGR